MAHTNYPQPNDWHVEPDASGFRIVVTPAAGGQPQPPERG